MRSVFTLGLAASLAAGCLLPSYAGRGDGGGSATGGSAGQGGGGGGALGPCLTEPFAIRIGQDDSGAIGVRQATVLADGRVVALGTYGSPLEVVAGQPLDASGLGSFVAAFGDGGVAAWATAVEQVNGVGPTIEPLALAATPDGGAVVALGYYQEPISLDGEEFQPEGWDTLVFKLGPSGAVAWSHVIGGPSNEFGTDLVVRDSDGAVFLVGNYNGADVRVDGGAPLANSNYASLFVAHFAADGAIARLQGFPSAGGPVEPARAALDAAGNLLVSGSYAGHWEELNLDLPDVPFSQKKGFVLAFDADDFPVAATSFGSAAARLRVDQFEADASGWTLLGITQSDGAGPMMWGPFSDDAHDLSAQAEVFAIHVTSPEARPAWFAYLTTDTALDPNGLYVTGVAISPEVTRFGVGVRPGGSAFPFSLDVKGTPFASPPFGTILIELSASAGQPLGTKTQTDEENRLSLTGSRCGELVLGRFSGAMSWDGKGLASFGPQASGMLAYEAGALTFDPL